MLQLNRDLSLMFIHFDGSKEETTRFCLLALSQI